MPTGILKAKSKLFELRIYFGEHERRLDAGDVFDALRQAGLRCDVTLKAIEEEP